MKFYYFEIINDRGDTVATDQIGADDKASAMIMAIKRLDKMIVPEVYNIRVTTTLNYNPTL